MVSWSERAQADDKLVALAVDKLLEFRRRYPEASVDQVTEMMQVLSQQYGRVTAATAYQALRTSRELWDLWGLLPEPVPAGVAPPEQVAAATAWALQTRSGRELTGRELTNRLAGVLTRTVRQPGRETIFEATRAAKTRWARVPGPHACAFCLMLASRGAVYESKVSASTTSGTRGTRPAGLRFHDRCTCHIVESYTDADLPGVTKALNAEWYEVTWDENGPVADQAGVWREHIEATRPESTTLRPAPSVAPEREAAAPGRSGQVTRPVGLLVAAHESAAAERLAAHGLDVVFRELDPTPGVKNPDIEIDGEAWEIKSPRGSSSKNTISDQFKRARRQASRLVLDLSRCGVAEELAIRQATRRFHGQKQIQRLIIIKKDGSLIELAR